MLRSQHYANGAGTICDFVQQHRCSHNPANFFTSLKGTADGHTVKKTMHTDASRTPRTNLTRMIIAGWMISLIAMVRPMLKKVEHEKSKATGKQQVMMMPRGLGRFEQLQGIRNHIHKCPGHQHPGTKGEHQTTIGLQAEDQQPSPQRD
jgi:hypothetical protein